MIHVTPSLCAKSQPLKCETRLQLTIRYNIKGQIIKSKKREIGVKLEERKRSFIVLFNIRSISDLPCIIRVKEGKAHSWHRRGAIRLHRLFFSFTPSAATLSVLFHSIKGAISCFKMILHE